MKWLVFWLALVPASAAWAVLTDSLTIGNARALSLGNAVTADPPGIDSIHFNPAGLARLQGRQAHLKVVGATFGIDLTFGEYNDERQRYLDQKQALGIFDDAYFFDEAHRSSSETEGATLMLPIFSMTDIPVLLAPLGGASYRPEDSAITYATNVYAPMMVGFHRADDDPGRWIGQRLAFSVLTYFSPSFAFAVNDEWSIGAALTFNYAGIGIELPFRSPHIGIEFLGELQYQVCPDLLPFICGGQLGLYDALGTLEFEVDTPLTLGFNVGVLWQPQPWLTFGAVYQAPIPMQMSGDFTWVNGAPWNAFIGELAQTPGYDAVGSLLGVLGWSLPQGQTRTEGKATLDMQMPEHLALGVSVQVMPRVKLNVDYKYTGWSDWDSIPVEFSESIDFLRLAQIVQPDLVGPGGTGLTFPLGLEDSWNWALGVEYQWNDTLVLRAGIEDRPSSIPESANSPLLPIGSGQLYGVGFGWQPNQRTTVDMALGYFSTSVFMPGGSSELGNSTNPLLVIYNPYAGTDVTADMTAIMLEFSYVQHF